MTDRELLELIATQVGKLTADVDEIKVLLPTLATKEELAYLATKEDLAGVKSEIDSLKSIVIRIENDHGQKLGVLLNGYKQNAERLDRVEAKLAEHDEILMKKF
ncbi:MAG: hypothetical protein GX883_01225 [Firmicutes bacterium]|nr:hypothetical protein [Bacillota bacterium]